MRKTVKKENLTYLPLFLNIAGKRCVVVGGGRVALRKVRMLLDFGAKVTVVSPELCLEISELAEGGKIGAVKRVYSAGDLKGAFVAVAATGSGKTNQEVAEEARRLGVLVNVVDAPGLSDFIVPSYLRRGDVVIAVSTGGRSPALARKIRTALEQGFGDEYAELASLVGEVRAEVRRLGIKLDGDAWRDAIALDVLVDLLKQGKSQEARDMLLNELKKRRAR
ncbi:MAG: bifunctional precorrin-2 dehydrogenase/sirohydrochlorin ferrochelatase [Dehalococcoidia bacterium]|nr:bifunctional precorrin-2 dehydrogenase/sirohydrochlorin ferrochelatase [Dehalococcoidia bacterium]